VAAAREVPGHDPRSRRAGTRPEGPPATAQPDPATRRIRRLRRTRWWRGPRPVGDRLRYPGHDQPNVNA
jgi:hypothetical protein